MNASGQRHESGPEQTIADSSLPGNSAHELKLAVIVNAEESEAGRDADYSALIAHGEGGLIGHDKEAATRIQSECAGLESVRVRALDTRRLPGFLVDREHSD